MKLVSRLRLTLQDVAFKTFNMTSVISFFVGNN